MKKLTLISLAFLIIVSCKKKKIEPDAISIKEPVVKNYRISVRQSPNQAAVYGSDTLYLSLKVNQDLISFFKCIPTQTVGIWLDLISNTQIDPVIGFIPYFKTGDNITWSYKYFNNSGNKYVKYYITDLFITEKETKNKSTIFKMIKPDSIPFINNLASVDYSFKIP